MTRSPVAMSMMAKRWRMKKEIGTSLGIIVFCGLLVHQALALPKPRFEPLGPAFFPLLVMGCIVGLSILHIGLVLWRARRSTPKKMGVPAERWRPTFRNLLPLLTVLAFAAYILLISYTEISYLVLTFAFVALLSWTMASFRRSAILFSLGVAAGLVVVVQGVFVTTLNIILP